MSTEEQKMAKDLGETLDAQLEREFGKRLQQNTSDQLAWISRAATVLHELGKAGYKHHAASYAKEGELTVLGVQYEGDKVEVTYSVPAIEQGPGNEGAVTVHTIHLPRAMFTGSVEEGVKKMVDDQQAAEAAELAANAMKHRDHAFKLVAGIGTKFNMTPAEVLAQAFPDGRADIMVAELMKAWDLPVAPQTAEHARLLLSGIGDRFDFNPGEVLALAFPGLDHVQHKVKLAMGVLEHLELLHVDLRTRPQLFDFKEVRYMAGGGEVSLESLQKGKDAASPLPSHNEPAKGLWQPILNWDKAKTAERLEIIEKEGMNAVGEFEVRLMLARIKELEAMFSPATPWVPFLVDRADGVKGHYAIGRLTDRNTSEYWNLRQHRWASASDDVLTLDQANELLKNLVIPTSPRDQAAESLEQATNDLQGMFPDLVITTPERFQLYMRDAWEVSYSRGGNTMSRAEREAEFAKFFKGVQLPSKVVKQTTSPATTVDRPEMDGTDYAHPAWWRGHEQTTATFCQKVNDILDGKDDGSGVNHEPWGSLRRRLLAKARPHLEIERRATHRDAFNAGFKKAMSVFGITAVAVDHTLRMYWNEFVTKSTLTPEDDLTKATRELTRLAPYLGHAFITAVSGAGKRPMIMMQFDTIENMQAAHAILSGRADLAKPPIPEGVYYSPDSGNFHNASQGMGSAFYEEWFARRNEFPQSSQAKSEPNVPPTIEDAEAAVGQSQWAGEPGAPEAKPAEDVNAAVAHARKQIGMLPLDTTPHGHCSGCTDPRSEGTHSEGTIEHPLDPKVVALRAIAGIGLKYALSPAQVLESAFHVNDPGREPKGVILRLLEALQSDWGVKMGELKLQEVPATPENVAGDKVAAKPYGLFTPSGGPRVEDGAIYLRPELASELRTRVEGLKIAQDAYIHDDTFVDHNAAIEGIVGDFFSDIEPTQAHQHQQSELATVEQIAAWIEGQPIEDAIRAAADHDTAVKCTWYAATEAMRYKAFGGKRVTLGRVLKAVMRFRVESVKDPLKEAAAKTAAGAGGASREYLEDSLKRTAEDLFRYHKAEWDEMCRLLSSAQDAVAAGGTVNTLGEIEMPAKPKPASVCDALGIGDRDFDTKCPKCGRMCNDFCDNPGLTCEPPETENSAAITAQQAAAAKERAQAAREEAAQAQEDAAYKLVDSLLFAGLMAFKDAEYDDKRKAAAEIVMKQIDALLTPSLDALVDRFLAWPLPKSVCSDVCCTAQQEGRIGTNLLDATEARQMLEYVLQLGNKKETLDG
jgi:hypothetical protein